MFENIKKVMNKSNFIPTCELTEAVKEELFILMKAYNLGFTQLDLGGLRPNSNIFLQLIETMEQSNNNPQRMMVVLQSPTREISWLDRTFIGISDDAGETWAWMCPFELRSHQGFERAKLAIDPIDDNHIFIYGKDYRYEGYKTIVMETFDSFQSSFWSYIPYGLYALYWEEYLSNIIFFTSYEEQFSRKIIANNPMNGILCMNDETRQWSYIQSEQYYLFDDIAAIGSTLYGLKLDANVQGGSLNVYESDDCGYSWKFLDSDFAVGSNMDDSWYFKGAEMNLRTAVCQGNIYVYRTEDIYEYTPSLNKITDISNKEKLPDVFYNVGGQKITHPQSGGIYIKNHRKVIKNTK